MGRCTAWAELKYPGLDRPRRASRGVWRDDADRTKWWKILNPNYSQGRSVGVIRAAIGGTNSQKSSIVTCPIKSWRNNPMKKPIRRAKSTKSSKRPVRSKIKKIAAKARTKLARARSAVRPSSKTRTRVKRVAKRAATAGVVAAGAVALGTALAELRPDSTDSKKAVDEPK